VHLIIQTKNKIRLNRIIEWLIYIILYLVIFMLVTTCFKSVYIDKNHYFLYSMLIVLIIYMLNITVKPIFVKLTIPITGMTLGLFYPFINFFILKLADWILRGHFEINKFWYGVLVALLISGINLLIDEIIIKPILKKVRKNG